MCGITGYFDRGPDRPERAAELDEAVLRLHHRGPNDRGTWRLDDGIGLGHTRLAILDLSAIGHQPMVSNDGRLVMVFNGEIYNFPEIRRELEMLNQQFAGVGDSEVILAAFAVWGLKAVDRFVGMFAIALWDREQRSLSLLRDRLGVKPLYYSWDGTHFCFGSELKALRAFLHWTPQIDQAALGEYLQFGYINAPRTIYRHVYKLAPGHTLAIGGEGEPVISRYWSALDKLATPMAVDEAVLTIELEALMADAFALRMVADVPVGVFLSGGVDSSVLTAILQKNHDQTIHTFTIGMDSQQHDEAPHARRVADHLGTTHTEQLLGSNEGKSILLHWGQLYDEPFFDSSGIPTYLVSQMAGRQVKVVLSADGGDELFCGYNVYAGVLDSLARRERLPMPVQRAVHAVLRALPLNTLDRMVAASPLPAHWRRWLRRKVTQRARGLRTSLSGRSAAVAYEHSVSIWQPDEVAALTGHYKAVRETIAAYPGTVADQMCLWDIHNYLPGDILAKVDRASMAVSVEGREPLLDHRLVEFALRLPLALRRGVLGGKHVLRRILYGHVPRELVERPKQGFAIPLLAWLRGDLAHLLDDYLDPRQIAEQGIFDPAMVHRTVQAFRRGDDSVLNKVWSLLAFQMWRRTWC